MSLQAFSQNRSLFDINRDSGYEALAKSNYDRALKFLIEAQQSDVLQQQKEVKVQDNLSALNKDLERLVAERTEKLSIKTGKLVQYSYTNAHDLRGPVARLMGLVAIQRIDANPDHVFFYNKIVEQAHEIDSVVRKINVDLMTSMTDD